VPRVTRVTVEMTWDVPEKAAEHLKNTIETTLESDLAVGNIVAAWVRSIPSPANLVTTNVFIEDEDTCEDFPCCGHDYRGCWHGWIKQAVYDRDDYHDDHPEDGCK